MALIKCPECGRDVSDSAITCPNCGYPLKQNQEEEKESVVEQAVTNESEDSEVTNPEIIQAEVVSVGIPTTDVKVSEKKKFDFPKNKKIIIGIGAVAAVAIIGGILFYNSDPSKYNRALKAYNNKDYVAAADGFKKVMNYKDAEKMYTTALHKEDVRNDKTAPQITVDEDSIVIDKGGNFDVNEWVNNHVNFSDSVSTDLKKDIKSNIDTEKTGEYTIDITCVDEAGNEATKTVYAVVQMKYEDLVYLASYTMLKEASSAEDYGNLIRKVWYNAIFKEEDTETNKYTKKSGTFVSDFNDALSNLFADEYFRAQLDTLKLTRDSVKNYMKQLKDRSTENSDAYAAVCTLYSEYTKLVDLVTSPTGSLTTYTSEFRDADTGVSDAFNTVELYFDN